MVVLTIVSQKNGEDVYFDPPLPKEHFMKLLSCSLYNCWDTQCIKALPVGMIENLIQKEKFPNCPPVIMILTVWQKKNNKSVLRVVI